MNQEFANWEDFDVYRAIEQWRNLKPGMRVRVKNTPLSRSEAGRMGEFIEYTPKGYARVSLDPKPEWRDKTADLWLLHPESLEVA